MKIIKSCFKNYLTLLLALLLAGVITLIACKPEVPLGAPTRGWRYLASTGLEAWGENSSGGGVRGFYIDSSGRIWGVSTVNASDAQIGQLTANTVNATIGRSATLSISTSNSTNAEIRQADYYASNSTNMLAKWALAMAALPIRGGSVQLFSGNYTSSNNLTLSVPGTTVFGQGYNTAVSMNASGAVFYVTANDTALENLRTDIGGIVTMENVDAPKLVNVQVGNTVYYFSHRGTVVYSAAGSTTVTTNTTSFNPGGVSTASMNSTLATVTTGTVTTISTSNWTGVSMGSSNMSALLWYVQVQHDLGVTPKHVYVTPEYLSANITGYGLFWVASNNWTSTEFQILCTSNLSAIQQLGWMAVAGNY